MKDTSPNISEPSWAKPAVAGFALLSFVVAMAVAYFSKSESAMLLLMGACITNGTTVVGYYFGSSSGSSKKTELLTQVMPDPEVLAPVTPVVPGVPGVPVV